MKFSKFTKLVQSLSYKYPFEEGQKDIESRLWIKLLEISPKFDFLGNKKFAYAKTCLDNYLKDLIKSSNIRKDCSFESLEGDFSEIEDISSYIRGDTPVSPIHAVEVKQLFELIEDWALDQEDEKKQLIFEMLSPSEALETFWGVIKKKNTFFHRYERPPLNIISNFLGVKKKKTYSTIQELSKFLEKNGYSRFSYRKITSYK